MAENKIVGWDRLYVRVTPRSGWSTYRAWGEGIEFRGTTLGYANDVEDILRRMVRAKRPPEDVVVKTATLLFEHIQMYLKHIDVLGDDHIGTAVEYEDPESPYRSYTLYIEVSTQRINLMDRVMIDGKEDLGPVEPGWLVTIIATYKGNDGNGIGEHTVKRKLVFRNRIDPEVLWGEMMRTISYAVNALPTE